jgi:hypothetical protein
VSKGAHGGRGQAPVRQRGEGYLMSKMAQTKRREKDSATNSKLETSGYLTVEYVYYYQWFPYF